LDRYTIFIYIIICPFLNKNSKKGIIFVPNSLSVRPVPATLPREPVHPAPPVGDRDQRERPTLYVLRGPLQWASGVVRYRRRGNPGPPFDTSVFHPHFGGHHFPSFSSLFPIKFCPLFKYIIFSENKSFFLSSTKNMCNNISWKNYV
jgi:hypothetical protein